MFRVPAPHDKVEDLRSQLGALLGSTYRVDRELGGGGMSRVFLAEEVALARQVVIKVLPPEMAAGVNQERFRREIQLAARLQHPHIVPLLTAGAAGDLLYYVMPFIKGESLRAKLEREGELPIVETIRILREVTDALAYAHAEGVVHRDIKPDNVMISGGHALVTDFGVAKAVSEATGGHSLTSFGLAIGTPAYMAPEQAAGDPHVDHRADLYALGAMAFEMLAGRTPFVGGSPQAVLAAHVTQMPERVSQLRPAVPVGLNGIVMRCLEKRAADRWQLASELLPQFDLLLTPSTGGTAPTSAAWMVSTGTEAALRRSQPVRVLLTFLLAAVGVLGFVWLLVHQLGLPTWVLYAAAALMMVGLPIVVLTGRRERQLAIARTTNATLPSVTGVERYFTWRKAIAGGTIAFAALGALATVYMAMRLLGVGSVGTLMAKGTLKERDRIVLAEFENRTGDSTLATTVTELLRMDLAQSRSVSVYDAAQLAGVLARMQVPRDAHVTFDVAKEAATREGLKAILAGDVAPLGKGFVVSARLVATGTGDVLWAGHEQVSGPEGLSAALDKLSGTLRERVGESLRTIRSDPPLEQITTKSIESLRLFAQAERADNSGDRDGAMALLERAIAGDSGFAMAYRKLGILVRNRSLRDSARYLPLFTRAYELRDRLSVRERLVAEAAYHQMVKHDTTPAISAYRALIDQYPDDRIAPNNLGMLYRAQGKRAEALAMYRRSLRVGGAPPTTYGNALFIVSALEGLDSAHALVDAFQAAYPDNPSMLTNLTGYLLATEQYDSAQRILERRSEAAKGTPRLRAEVLFSLSELLYTRGQFERALTVIREAIQLETGLFPLPPEAHVTPAQVVESRMLDLRAEMAKEVYNDTAAALAAMKQSIARLPVERRQEQPHLAFLEAAQFFASIGQVATARDYWRKAEAAMADSDRTNPTLRMLRVRSYLAKAEGRYDDALRDLRATRDRSPNCGECELDRIADLYEAKGQLDSAVTTLEQFFEAPRLSTRAWADQYESIGKWYEARNDSAKASRAYAKAAELWKTADAPLQPRVARWRAKALALSRGSAP